VDKDLYHAILNRCVEDGKMCMHQMMAIDAAGGAGKGGIASLTRIGEGDRQRTVVAALCTPANPSGAALSAALPATINAQ